MGEELQEDETGSGRVGETAADAAQRIPTTVTELGFEVDESEKTPWRVATGERWERDHPLEVEFVLHLIREEGITCVSTLGSRLEAQFARVKGTGGAMRTMIGKLMREKFQPEELERIERMNVFIARSEGIAKTTELMPLAKSKGDLPGVAMSTKMMHDIHQGVAGQPSEIKEVRFVVEDLEAMREEARKLREGAARVPVVIDAEMVRLGDKEK